MNVIAETLEVASIIIDPDVQPRQDGLDADHVGVLQEVGPEGWPPLVVVARDSGYVLVDGRHRLEAAARLGLAEVACELRAAPDDGDLKALAFALNRDHGKPLTLVDRKAEARRLLRDRTDLSDRAIAERCALSDKTVGTVRDELERTAEIPQLESRVGTDGKTRPVTPTPKATRSTPNRSATDTGDIVGRTGQKRAGASAATRLDPAFAALLDVVDRMRAYSDDHAADGLADAIAVAVTDHRRQSEWSEFAGVLETWGAAFTGACDALRKRSNDETADLLAAGASADSGDAHES